MRDPVIMNREKNDLETSIVKPGPPHEHKHTNRKLFLHAFTHMCLKSYTLLYIPYT